MTTFDISCHAVYYDECKYRKGGEQSSDPLIRPTIAGIPHRGAAVIGMEKERKQAGYDQHGWQGDTEMVGAVCAANVRRIHYWIRRSIHHGRLPELLQVHYGYRRRVRRLKNYTRALQDKEFLHALGFSTLLTIVTTIVINVVAFSIAYMLTKAIKGSNIFRSVFFMPNLIGGIILGYIWMLLLNGILAHWARSLTYSATYGFWGLVVLVCWQQIGYMMIIYIAGMQSLPTDVLEAASVDGANGTQTMFKIIIPLMMPSITVCSFLCVTNGFKLYDQNLALTNGAPSNMSEGLAMNITRTFYGRVGWEGVGQAKAVLFFVLVAIVALIQNKLTTSKEVEA